VALHLEQLERGNPLAAIKLMRRMGIEKLVGAGAT
jgi:hypothetical protein